MKVYDLRDPAGRVFAFEISNTWFRRTDLIRFVGSIPGVSLLPREARRDETRDEFCQFLFRGRQFVAWEPWSDNSRYWIGPDPPEWCEEISELREAFAARKTWPWERK
jgi:hypothetical protein